MDLCSMNLAEKVKVKEKRLISGHAAKEKPK
jgi:hypothetical protein